MCFGVVAWVGRLLFLVVYGRVCRMPVVLDDAGVGGITMVRNKGDAKTLKCWLVTVQRSNQIIDCNAPVLVMTRIDRSRVRRQNEGLRAYGRVNSEQHLELESCFLE